MKILSKTPLILVLIPSFALADGVHHNLTRHDTQVIEDTIENTKTDQLNQNSYKHNIPQIHYQVRSLLVKGSVSDIHKYDALISKKMTDRFDIDDALYQITPKKHYRIISFSNHDKDDAKPLDQNLNIIGDVNALGTHQAIFSDDHAAFVINLLKQHQTEKHILLYTPTNRTYNLQNTEYDIHVFEQKNRLIHDRQHAFTSPYDIEFGQSVVFNVSNDIGLSYKVPLYVDYLVNYNVLRHKVIHRRNRDIIKDIETHNSGQAKLEINRVNVIINPQSKLLKGQIIILVKPTLSYKN